MRKGRYKIKYVLMLVLLFSLVLLSGCKNKQEANESTENMDTSYDGAGNINIILNIDAENKKIRLLSIKNQEIKELEYGGYTDIKDKYKDVIGAALLEPGDIAKISYEDGRITKIYLYENTEEWEFEGGIELVPDISAIEINGVKYKYDDSLRFFSNGEEIAAEALHEKDLLEAKIIGNQIYVITVKQGHGYIKLENYDDFIGGFIEAGKEIAKITYNMEFVVPEGSYNVRVANNGYGGSIDVDVGRDEEVIIDAKPLYQKLNKYGSVTFKITPEEAVVYVNGRKITNGEIVDLDYGLHSFAVTADGYERYTGSLYVRSSTAIVEITLNKESLESEEETKETEESTTETKEESTKTEEESSSVEKSAD